MESIKTKSFELAILSRGDKNSERLAILLPGRLDTKDYNNFVSHADYLAGKGFFAVAIDPPGTWESAGDIGLYTTTNYIKAVNELIEFYGSKATLLLGHSRGASVAILASLNPLVVGIVAIMTNFTEPTQPDEAAMQNGFKLSFRDFPPGTHKTDKQKVFSLPISYWEDGKKYNAGQELKNCKKPKLLIYADNDKFTPPDAVEKLFQEIPEPKMIKKMHCSHDYRNYPEVVKLVESEVGNFLKTNNLC